MALSGVIKHSLDGGVIKFIDATPTTPLELELRFDNADFEVSGIVAGGRETVAYEGRAKLRSLRKGKPKWPTWSCSVQITELSEATDGTVADWVFKRAPFASRVSTTASIGDADTFHVEFTQDGVGGTDQVFLLEDVTWEKGFKEGEPNTFTLSGTVYGDIKINGAAAHVAPRE